MKNIGDTLTDDEFNGIISLLRHNEELNESIIVQNGDVLGDYGKYTFNLQSTTIVDIGVLITDETLSNLGTVKLSSPIFSNATYTLFLTVYSFDDVNIVSDAIVSSINTTTIQVELINDVAVTIPFETLTKNCIVGFDASITIKQDKPVIVGAYLSTLTLTASKSVIMDGTTSTIKIKAKDSNNLPVPNKQIKLYEVYTPTLKVSAIPNPVQAGETTTVKIILEDTDGSRIPNKEIKLYEVTTPEIIVTANPQTITSGETSTIKIVLKDINGKRIPNKEIKLYKEG